MNFTNFDALKLTFDAQDLTKRFCKIYENVIKSYFEFNRELISETKEILNSISEQEHKINTEGYKLAFLLSFAVQDTCLSATKFYESLMKNILRTNIIKKFSQGNRMKLCCFESASLPTVMGVCQVIDEIIENLGTRSNFDYCEIQISVFDKRKSWRRLCGCIVDTFNSYFKNIELKLGFADGLGITDWKQLSFTGRITKADLVIFARIATDYNPWHLKVNLVILEEMLENSIFIRLESKSEEHSSMLKSLISRTASFSEIKSCQISNFSLQDLGKHSSNLPVNWQTHFQPVIFTTWIKCSRVGSLEKQYIHIDLDSGNQLVQSKQMIKERKKALFSVKHDTPHDDMNTKIPSEASNTQITSSVTNKKVKSSTKPKHINVASDAAHSQMLLRKPNKKANSKLSEASTAKIITSNQENLAIYSKRVENKRVAALEAKITKFKKGCIDQSSEKSTKENSESEKTTLKSNSEAKRIEKNVPISAAQNVCTKTIPLVKLTKKSNKTLPAQNIKLTGKSARIDLKKKIKNETRWMRAKKETLECLAEDYFTNMQNNKNKCSKSKNKQSAKIVKTSNNLWKLFFTCFTGHSKINREKCSFSQVATADEEVSDLKYKYVHDNEPNTVVGKLSCLNLLKKGKYYKQNTLSRRNKDLPRKLDSPILPKKNKYKKSRLMEYQLSVLRYYDDYKRKKSLKYRCRKRPKRANSKRKMTRRKAAILKRIMAKKKKTEFENGTEGKPSEISGKNYFDSEIFLITELFS